MPEKCPRCGYPEVGPRVLSVLPSLPQLLVCIPCAMVEGEEMAQLGRVLPFPQWAVND